MPKLIRWRAGQAVEIDDRFIELTEDESLPAGDVIVPIAGLEREGGALWSSRSVGVRLAAGERVEVLAPFLSRLALVALEFPKFKDGRAYSAAAILRGRLGFTGEVRAVGEVLREQAGFMVRAGFDAFVPADGAGAADWSRAARRYRHVYQRAADHRPTASDERRFLDAPPLAA